MELNKDGNFTDNLLKYLDGKKINDDDVDEYEEVQENESDDEENESDEEENESYDEENESDEEENESDEEENESDDEENESDDEEENERDEEENNDKKNDNENSIIAQDEGCKKILEICNSTLTGQILFFANGQNEILKAVKTNPTAFTPEDLQKIEMKSIRIIKSISSSISNHQNEFYNASISKYPFYNPTAGLVRLEKSETRTCFHTYERIYGQL